MRPTIKVVKRPEIEDEAGERLDLWLWASRLFRTRTLAKAAITASRVRVNGVLGKPSRLLRIADQLQVVRGLESFDLEVRGFSRRRIAASGVAALYVESPESQQRRAEVAATRKAERAGFSAPPGRPDKRARKLIRALGDIEMM